MKIKTFLFPVLVLLHFSSCKKESPTRGHLQNNQPRPQSGSIIGIWTWYQSIDFWFQEIVTPQLTNETKHLHFLPDSTVRFYKNGILESTKTWSVQRGGFPQISPPFDTLVSLHISGLTTALFSLKGDTLIIRRQYNDLDDDYYKWAYQP